MRLLPGEPRKYAEGGSHPVPTVKSRGRCRRKNRNLNEALLCSRASVVPGSETRNNPHFSAMNHPAGP
jgi:hypothetical protein